MFRNPVYDMMIVVPALLIAGLLGLFVMTTPARAEEIASTTATSTTGSAAITASTSGTTYPDLSERTIVVDRGASVALPSTSAPSVALGVHSTDDLVAYARQTLGEDGYVKSISLSPESIVVTYYKPGRLLGLVPLPLPRRATVRTDGSVMFEEPWYAPITLADKDHMKSALEVRVHALLTSEGYLPSMKLAPITQAEILDIVRQLVG